MADFRWGVFTLLNVTLGHQAAGLSVEFRNDIDTIKKQGVFDIICQLCSVTEQKWKGIGAPPLTVSARAADFKVLIKIIMWTAAGARG